MLKTAKVSGKGETLFFLSFYAGKTFSSSLFYFSILFLYFIPVCLVLSLNI